MRKIVITIETEADVDLRSLYELVQRVPQATISFSNDAAPISQQGPISQFIGEPIVGFTPKQEHQPVLPARPRRRSAIISTRRARHSAYLDRAAKDNRIVLDRVDGGNGIRLNVEATLANMGLTEEQLLTGGPYGMNTIEDALRRNIMLRRRAAASGEPVHEDEPDEPRGALARLQEWQRQDPALVIETTTLGSGAIGYRANVMATLKNLGMSLAELMDAQVSWPAGSTEARLRSSVNAQRMHAHRDTGTDAPSPIALTGDESTENIDEASDQSAEDGVRLTH